jgi:hypothetical protein
MKTLHALQEIQSRIGSDPLPKAEYAWRGADVVISTSFAPTTEPTNGFYPEPRMVVSLHALELSWLFEALRDAFYAEGRLDGQSKIEFFGRLANAANRCLRTIDDPSAQVICGAVLHEAFAIYDEMDEGSFKSLSLAAGNEIADDYVDDALRTGFIGVENTKQFFLNRGIDIENS